MQSQAPEIWSDANYRVYVDAHVHIHNCFDIQRFLDAAERNFSSHASRFEIEGDSRFALCLTETYGTNAFQDLTKQIDDPQPDEGHWRLRSSGEKECLVASHPRKGDIAIIAGRQIVTAERLEILGLGLLGSPEDGLPISDVIKWVAGRGAIPVLPWGFGKWLGARRHVVSDVIEKFGGGSLYLGDNSGRPGIMPTPAEFALANESGMKVLPGSDPLPFSSEYDRAGSFGFYVDNMADSNGFWSGLRTMLQQGEGDLHSYGSLESPLRFVRNQVAMQYVTRVAPRRKAN